MTVTNSEGHSSYLHSSNVYRQYCGEKEHLQEEIGHQAHDSKQTELLKKQMKPNHGHG